MRRCGIAPAGRYYTTVLRGPDQGSPAGRGEPVSDEPVHGRVVATRRAVIDIVRSATLGSYGVSGFAGGPVERVLARLQGRQPGLRVSFHEGAISIDLRLRISHRLPIAEVARQVDSAIRYSLLRALGREVGHLTIRVAGLEVPAPEPSTGPAAPAPDAADAGPATDPADAEDADRTPDGAA